MAERTFSSGTEAEKEPRSLVPLLVGKEPWNVPWSRREIFFLSLLAGSPLVSPPSGLISLSRRKFSRKPSGTRTLGTRLRVKFPADKISPFPLRQPIRTQNLVHLAISRSQACNV